MSTLDGVTSYAIAQIAYYLAPQDVARLFQCGNGRLNVSLRQNVEYFEAEVPAGSLLPLPLFNWPHLRQLSIKAIGNQYAPLLHLKRGKLEKIGRQERLTKMSLTFASCFSLIFGDSGGDSIASLFPKLTELELHAIATHLGEAELRKLPKTNQLQTLRLTALNEYQSRSAISASKVLGPNFHNLVNLTLVGVRMKFEGENEELKNIFGPLLEQLHISSLQDTNILDYLPPLLKKLKLYFFLGSRREEIDICSKIPKSLRSLILGGLYGSDIIISSSLPTSLTEMNFPSANVEIEAPLEEKIPKSLTSLSSDVFDQIPADFILKHFQEKKVEEMTLSNQPREWREVPASVRTFHASLAGIVPVEMLPSRLTTYSTAYVTAKMLARLPKTLTSFAYYFESNVPPRPLSDTLLRAMPSQLRHLEIWGMLTSFTALDSLQHVSSLQSLIVSVGPECNQLLPPTFAQAIPADCLEEFSISVHHATVTYVDFSWMLNLARFSKLKTFSFTPTSKFTNFWWHYPLDAEPRKVETAVSLLASLPRSLLSLKLPFPSSWSADTFELHLPPNLTQLDLFWEEEVSEQEEADFLSPNASFPSFSILPHTSLDSLCRGLPRSLTSLSFDSSPYLPTPHIFDLLPPLLFHVRIRCELLSPTDPFFQALRKRTDQIPSLFQHRKEK